jgi:hypothetical protein
LESEFDLEPELEPDPELESEDVPNSVGVLATVPEPIREFEFCPLLELIGDPLPELDPRITGDAESELEILADPESEFKIVGETDPEIVSDPFTVRVGLEFPVPDFELDAEPDADLVALLVPDFTIEDEGEPDTYLEPVEEYNGVCVPCPELNPEPVILPEPEKLAEYESDPELFEDGEIVSEPLELVEGVADVKAEPLCLGDCDAVFVFHIVDV